MKSFIRFLEIKRWLNAYEKGNPLLNSRVISDIRVDMQNNTSIYELSNDGSNLAKIILAFAEKRQGFERVDYIEFDENELDSLSFSTKQNTSLNTKIKDVKAYHYDLQIGKVDRLIKLAEFIYSKSSQSKGKTATQVKQLFEGEIGSGNLTKTDLNPALQKHLD
jgi:hypothetical protein